MADGSVQHVLTSEPEPVPNTAAMAVSMTPKARSTPMSQPTARTSTADERLIGAALSDGRIVSAAVPAWRRAFAEDAPSARRQLEAIQRHRGSASARPQTAGARTASTGLQRVLRSTNAAHDAHETVLGGERRR